LTPEVLQSIANQLNRLNSFYEAQFNSKSVIEFPDTFEVMDHLGFSVGKFVFNADTEKWIFYAYETVIL
jgi:hypothetical protein